MSDNSKDQAHSCLDNNDFKTNLKTNNVKFAAIPNQLVDAWLAGNISDPCFKLVTICLRHAESFHIKHNYLTKFCKMNGNTVKKAQNEAIKRNILEITKTRVNRSFENHYRVKDISEWNLEAVHTLTSELVNFTSSHLNDSELNDSLLNDSVVHYLKNTNPKNTNPKKTKNKKTNVCEERARVRVYDQTNRLEERHTHTEWVSVYSPETVVNRLADLGCIKTGNKGFIENVTFWNKEARDSLGALETDQLTEFIVYTKKSLGKGKLKPTEGILSTLLTAWHSRKKEAISTEPQYFEEIDHLEVKDDCPF